MEQGTKMKNFVREWEKKEKCTIRRSKRKREVFEYVKRDKKKGI